MPQHDNIVPIDAQLARAKKPQVGSKTTRLLAACLEIAEENLYSALDRVFDRVDDSLFDLADKAEKSAQQAAFFAAMRTLRRERGAMESTFRNNLVGNFERFWESGQAVFSPDTVRAESELGLMNDAQLEESLALNNMIAKGQNRFDSFLYALNRRFSAMADGPADLIDNATNPLGPRAICYALERGVDRLSVDTNVKLVLFKLFDRFAINRLDELYSLIEQRLIEAGVLPNLRPEPVPERPLAKDDAADPAKDGQAAEKEAEDPGLFDQLRGLLSRVTQRGLRGRAGAGRGDSALVPPAAGAPVVAAPPMDMAELVRSLSALQSSDVGLVQYTEGESPQAPDNPQVALLSAVQSVGGGAIQDKGFGPADNDTIDVITMLFEFILDDANLPDSMKALLSRLQIPMLKVAIMDREFFSRKSHPARQLLNTLAKSALSWSEADGRGRGSLYALIDHTVQRVLTEFGDDVTLFTTLQNDLMARLQRDQQRATVIERRVTQNSRGQHRRRRAEAAVEKVWIKLVGKRPIGAAVADLLQAWHNVLRLTALRYELDSATWRERVSLLDRLMRSMEPRPTKKERQALLDEIPTLIPGLREGLEEIEYDRHRLARDLKALQAIHFACLRGDEHPEAAHPTLPNTESTVHDVAAERAAAAKKQKLRKEPRMATTPSSDLAPLVEQVVLSTEQSGEIAADSADRFDAQVHALKAGDWLEFQDAGDARSVRAKLAWRSDVNARLVFVDRKGAKVAEITESGLATALRRGSARCLSDVDVPIMDRALDAMLKALRKKQPA